MTVEDMSHAEYSFLSDESSQNYAHVFDVDDLWSIIGDLSMILLF